MQRGLLRGLNLLRQGWRELGALAPLALRSTIALGLNHLRLLEQVTFLGFLWRHFMQPRLHGLRFFTWLQLLLLLLRTR